MKNIFKRKMSDKPSDWKRIEENLQSILKKILSKGTNVSKKDLALAYNDLGHSKYMQVKFDEAIKDYTKSISYDSKLSIAFYNKATVHYRMGDFGKALSDFKTALELDPNNEEFAQGKKACDMEINYEKNS